MDKPILYIGAVLKDVVCHVNAIPSPGEGVIVSSRTSRLGGCAFNMAMVSQYMGAPFTLFVPMGVGEVADFLKREMAHYGLTGTNIPGTTWDNGECLCLVSPDGERTMITTPGIERQFDESWFSGLNGNDYSYVVANGYEILGQGGRAILDFVESCRAEFVFAPGPCIGQIDDALAQRLRALKPIWHLNDDEVRTYTREDDIVRATELLYEEAGNTVIVTAGPDGTYMCDADGGVHVPTTPIVPIDTIGAGDSHLGTLLSARVLGKTWIEAISCAHDVSACICQTHGAVCTREAFPQYLLG